MDKIIRIYHEYEGRIERSPFGITRLSKIISRPEDFEFKRLYCHSISDGFSHPPSPKRETRYFEFCIEYSVSKQWKA